MAIGHESIKDAARVNLLEHCDAGDSNACNRIGDSTSKTKRYFKILVCVTLWWTSACAATLSIKRVVAPGSLYPNAIAFTSLTQLMIGAMAELMSRATKRSQSTRPDFLFREIVQLFGIGLLNAGQLSLNNKALQYLNVATRQMISSTSMLFMMSVAALWGLEGIDGYRILTALLMTCGGYLQGLGSSPSDGDGANHWLGVVLQFLSLLFGALRWALAQVILQHSPRNSAMGRLSKLQLLSHTMPITAVACTVLALLFEKDPYSSTLFMNWELYAYMLAISACLTMMLFMEFKLVKALSAVAFNVLSTIHQIPIVLAGVAFQGDDVSTMSAAAFGICIIGGLVYARAPSTAMRNDGGVARGHSQWPPSPPPSPERSRSPKHWFEALVPSPRYDARLVSFFSSAQDTALAQTPGKTPVVDSHGEATNAAAWTMVDANDGSKI